MKLIDILARELKVWPEGVRIITQQGSGYLFDEGNYPLDISAEVAEDNSVASITRAQWQAAVDALKTEKVVEWNGEGLPPVGTVCEFAGFNPEETLPTDPRVGDQVTVIAHFMSGSFEVAAFTFYAPPEFKYLQVAQGAYGCFRPIRTPEQIAAEERQRAIENLGEWLSENCSIPTPYLWEAAQKIYDAGYRKFEIVDN